MFCIYPVTRCLVKGMSQSSQDATFCADTRDSQKVRGHSQLRSHLLNAFKSYIIFRKDWFHSINNANIKKISAVVPKITELGYTWGILSVPRQFLESTSSKFCKETSI